MNERNESAPDQSGYFVCKSVPDSIMELYFDLFLANQSIPVVSCRRNKSTAFGLCRLVRHVLVGSFAAAWALIEWLLLSLLTKTPHESLT